MEFSDFLENSAEWNKQQLYNHAADKERREEEGSYQDEKGRAGTE